MWNRLLLVTTDSDILVSAFEESIVRAVSSHLSEDMI